MLQAIGDVKLNETLPHLVDLTDLEGTNRQKQVEQIIRDRNLIL